MPRVDGVHASPKVIAKAKKKARKSGVDVVFEKAFTESLPFPGAQFEVIMSSMMRHHLHRSARQQLVVEIRRALKPGGRLLVVGNVRNISRVAGRWSLRKTRVALDRLCQLRRVSPGTRA